MVCARLRNYAYLAGCGRKTLCNKRLVNSVYVPKRSDYVLTRSAVVFETELWNPYVPIRSKQPFHNFRKRSARIIRSYTFRVNSLAKTNEMRFGLYVPIRSGRPFPQNLQAPHIDLDITRHIWASSRDPGNAPWGPDGQNDCVPLRSAYVPLRSAAAVILGEQILGTVERRPCRICDLVRLKTGIRPCRILRVDQRSQRVPC